MGVQRQLRIYVQISTNIQTLRCQQLSWEKKTQKDLSFLHVESLPITPLKDSKRWLWFMLTGDGVRSHSLGTISEITNSHAHSLGFTFSHSQLIRSSWNGSDSPWHHHWVEGRSPLPIQWHWTWPLSCGVFPSLPALLRGAHDALLCDPWRSLHAQGHRAELPLYVHSGEDLSKFSMTRERGKSECVNFN